MRPHSPICRSPGIQDPLEWISQNTTNKQTNKTYMKKHQKKDKRKQKNKQKNKASYPKIFSLDKLPTFRKINQVLPLENILFSNTHFKMDFSTISFYKTLQKCCKKFSVYCPSQQSDLSLQFLHVGPLTRPPAEAAQGNPHLRDDLVLVTRVVLCPDDAVRQLPLPQGSGE